MFGPSLGAQDHVRTTAGFGFLGYPLHLVDGEGAPQPDPLPISIRLKESACDISEIPELCLASAAWAEALDAVAVG